MEIVVVIVVVEVVLLLLLLDIGSASINAYASAVATLEVVVARGVT